MQCNNCLKLLLFLWFYVPIFAQETVDTVQQNQTANYTNDYWQQKVDYDIQVALDDQKHEINGFITLNYTNNSPDELSFIYFHLWPNAYKNDQTAFAKQQIGNGSTDFYYAKSADRGYIDDLAFQGNGKTLTLVIDSTHIDIAKLMLAEPLKSGETMVLKSPFRVKIPKTFSRLGHIGQAYQLTQWYPKPAVYDQKGWHPMPYLDQGEFYSEFGDFDVKITVPKNYVVAATGDLQNEDEREWLLAQSKENKEVNNSDFPPSASETKTLHYRQENVHDFAWFADKRFIVRKGEVTLPKSGRKVDTWALFLPSSNQKLWQKGIDYINQGVAFYSKHIGEYPYNHATALEGPLEAGGGMEYPTITIVSAGGSALTLETVIVHEVGHNWFYGILGSNERRHAWMDEGINSYYEKRYLKEQHPDRKLVGRFAKTGLARLFDVDQYPSSELEKYAYLYFARKGSVQPIDLPSDEFTNMGYFSSVYGSAALAMDLLAAYLGQSEFDRIMQLYYQQYEFKHPQPEDFRSLFEKESGKYLDWLFDELLTTDKVLDYKIKKVTKEGEKIGKSTYDVLTIKNKYGNIRAPFTLSAQKNGKIISTRWFDGFNGQMDVLFPSLEYDELIIDKDGWLPEINRKNNHFKTKGLFKRSRPLKFQFLGSLENPEKTQIFFTPLLGYNQYDKLMLGMGFYNSLLPQQRLEYAFAPMFALGSKSLVGVGKINYHQYFTKGFLKEVELGLFASSFSHGNAIAQLADSTRLEVYNEPFHYYKIAPELTFHLRPKSYRSTVRQGFKIRHVNVRKDKLPTYDLAPHNVFTTGAYAESYYVNDLTYFFNNRRTLNPFNFNINLQQSQRFVKSSLEANYKINYANKKNKGFNARFFAGGFLYNNLRSLIDNDFKLSMSSLKGNQDYLFDQTYVGRLEGDGLWGRQLYPQGSGGFKLRTDRAGTVVGLSDKYLVAINLDADLPTRFPVSIYANFGYHDPKQLVGITENFVYDIGASLKIVPSMFEIYFPLLQSADYKNALESTTDNYFQRISFLLNINGLNPIKRVRELDF